MAAAVAGPPALIVPTEGGQNALLDADDASDNNPLYKQDQFRMYCLKVLPCSKRYCHDWTTCPFAHPAEKAKRRDPRIYTYTGVACPEMKKNNHCPAGDKCVYAHSVWEYWLHSSRYRTQLCNDGVSCKRKICFFAHTLEELRVSSVKVLHPEAERPGEGFELDPFAPSAPSNSSNAQGGGGGRQGGGPQRKGGHHGNKHQGGRHGMANGSHFSNGNSLGGGQQVPGFSMADLQQLTQLQAKLQAATGMGSLGALQTQLLQQQQQRIGGLGPGMMPGMADPAAMEHFMHQLMQQHQHQPHQQAELMQLMAGVLASQQQQQQQQAAAAAATAAMAAAAHAQASHTPAAVAAAAAHMQMLQNGGMPAPPGSMEAQQQHAAALAGVGGLPGVARHPNGMATPLAGGMSGPVALPHGPLNLHSMGGGRPSSNNNSARPGLGASATHMHHAPALGGGLPHDQHVAPDALLAQQFAGLGMKGGLGGMAPFPPAATACSNGNHAAANSAYSSSSSFAGAAAPTHGAVGGGPTFRRQRSLPPPHAAPVPMAQGAGRRASLQHPRSQHQQHGGGDTSLAAVPPPTRALRREGSGKHPPMLDPGTSSHGSMVPHDPSVAAPSSAGAAAVLQNTASAPVQMPRSGSRGTAAAAAAAAGASSYFSNNSLSRTGSGTSSSAGHNAEGVAAAEEAGPSA